MLNIDDILVVKNTDCIEIAFNGCKLIKSISGFEDFTEDQIKAWFIKEVLQLEEVK